MKKKFKSRKHFKYGFLLLCFFVLFLFGVFLRFFLSFNFINFSVLSLVDSSNIYRNLHYDAIFKYLFCMNRFDINSPNTILQSTMFYYDSIDDSRFFFVNSSSETSDIDSSLPLVYIYNTHDTEEYLDDYDVYNASLYLRDKLNELGINSIVEENRTSTIREANGWNYGQSYKASRINLERVKSENPSIKLFIDFHRDSVGHNSTYVSIGDKGYAKVLFVIGREHANYLENLHYTQSIDYLISSKFPGLSKGILEKEGPGVNGIYNQDVGYNVILLEVGGNENSTVEVNNTIEIISSVIKEKLYEEE